MALYKFLSHARKIKVKEQLWRSRSLKFFIWNWSWCFKWPYIPPRRFQNTLVVYHAIFFWIYFRPTGETSWCLLLVVGVSLAQDYRQITLDWQGKQQYNKNNHSSYLEKWLFEMIVNLIRKFGPSTVVNEVFLLSRQWF